ncbi:hypothetical protein BCY75_04685 [Latilactobacillus curvatus]|uniref:EpsG family protein n=1 Tax=Latilactobacillus curvatus TaxID=28038 RepID=UPI0008150CE1|nr:EpsG family protein [Latilactobacillus curvatus]ANY13325.1 hypothetical protein BCY75_04685 [Latilactobacillus curvatus]
MMLVISGLFYFINLISAVLKRNSRLLIAIIIIILILIASFPASTISDYFSYSYFYQDPLFQKSTFEFGYALLSSLAHGLGFDYSTFRFATFILGFSIFTLGISRYTKNLTMFLIFYIIYPFMDDIVQVRNFLTMSCVIMASTYLFRKNKTNWILYGLWIILGGSIHSSGYIYLLVIPIFYIFKLKYGRIFLLSLIPVLMTLSMIPSFRNILSLIFELLPLSSDATQKLSGYLANRANSAFIPLWFIVIGMIVISIYNYKYYMNVRVDKMNIAQYDERERMYYTSICFMVLSGLFSSYLTVDLEFFRIIRNLYPVLIASSISIYQQKKGSANKLLYGIILFVLVLLSFVYFTIISARWTNIIIPAFQGNTIFK